MMNTLMAAAASRLIGKVPDLAYGGVEQLITGSALASLVGVSQGTAFSNNAGWMRFEDKGKPLFISKQPLRRGVSWNQLNALGLVFGQKVVTISGQRYKVRLLTGGNGDPSSGAGGEWDKYMYSVSADRPVSYQGPRFAEFNAVDLSYGSGSVIYSSVCQETLSTSGANCVRRGRDNLQYYAGLPKTDTGTTVMWRPVLEPID